MQTLQSRIFHYGLTLIVVRIMHYYHNETVGNFYNAS